MTTKRKYFFFATAFFLGGVGATLLKNGQEGIGIAVLIAAVLFVFAVSRSGRKR